MMILKSALKKLFRAIRMIEEWSEENRQLSIYREKTEPIGEKIIISIWDILRFKDNTQAYHLNGVIGFEEWVDMDEILRRIKDIFGAEYKNFRSLYPYIKTLVDVGLMETTNAGGRRKWRKIAVLAQLPIAKEPSKEAVRIEEKKKKTAA